MSFATSAGAELLFERLSLSSLRSIATDRTFTKNFLQQLLRQSGREASEEAATEAANILADLAVMGDRSELRLYCARYMADHPNVSRAQADLETAFYALSRIASAAAAGAVSGGAMGAGALVHSNLAAGRPAFYSLPVFDGEGGVRNPEAFGVSDSSSYSAVSTNSAVASGDNGGDTEGNNIIFGSKTKSESKLNRQIKARGWTTQNIRNTVNTPYTTRRSTNRSTGHPATVYYTKEGAYVVVDNITNEVVQVSDYNKPSEWIPDSSIENPYIP